MLKNKRLEAIAALVKESGGMSVKDIAGRLDVSDMTVRRDLDELEGLGRVERVHGGARPAHARREYSHAEKAAQHPKEKRAIALQAAELVHDGQTIFIGTGTTCEILASCIAGRPIRIVTNSLPVMNALAESPETTVCAIGGLFRPNTEAFIGPIAEATISSLGMDACFLGCNGIADGNIYTSNIDEGTVQKLAIEVSEHAYILCDEAKFGVRDFYAFTNLDEIDGVLSSGEAS